MSTFPLGMAPIPTGKHAAPREWGAPSKAACDRSGACDHTPCPRHSPRTYAKQGAKHRREGWRTCDCGKTTLPVGVLAVWCDGYSHAAYDCGPWDAA